MITEKFKDLISAAILITLALALNFYLIPQYVSQAETAALSPRFFPYFGSLLIGIGGVTLLLTSLGLKAPEPNSPSDDSAKHLGTISPLVVILAMAIFIVFFEQVGYLFTAPPLVFVMMLIFGSRSVPLLFIVPLAVTAFLYLMFSTGFGVSLP